MTNALRAHQSTKQGPSRVSPFGSAFGGRISSVFYFQGNSSVVLFCSSVEKFISPPAAGLCDSCAFFLSCSPLQNFRSALQAGRIRAEGAVFSTVPDGNHGDNQTNPADKAVL